ncbi:caspase family protein [Reichenbachiella sp. MALMAid0571]|uniref:caspase family protein n=1 Tax=Reichenbachiella sp. MALMAid0571 TaxID=3143939 RepID=UPI0032DE45F0
MSDGTNGLYTSGLVKAMRVPGLTIEEVFKQVRINVLKKSEQKQNPWENSSLVGDFYFRK